MAVMMPSRKVSSNTARGSRLAPIRHLADRRPRRVGSQGAAGETCATAEGLRISAASAGAPSAWRADATMTAPATRRRARLASCRAAAGERSANPGDLLEVDGEQVVQHERQPLRGTEGVEHHEQRDSHGVGFRLRAVQPNRRRPQMATVHLEAIGQLLLLVHVSHSFAAACQRY